jgi:kumamolisin
MRPRQFTIALPVAGIAALGAFAATDAYGEFAARGGHVETPESSIEQPEHHGLRAHTNYKMFVPNAGGMASAQGSSLERPAQAGGPPFAGYFYETPASLGCVYQLVSSVPGCNPNIVTANPSGGSRAIAIVDAYHYPTAASDLSVFSYQFGLPQANFQVVYANGRQPPVNANWNVEEALDIEWAHAIAPGAKIYLVEAASSNFSDLLQAVSVANSLVSQAGGGEVSMSWGGSEFSGETSYDSYFTQSGVVYFASSGDSPGVIWPSSSRNVVSVGGTSLSRNPTKATSSKNWPGSQGAAAPASTKFAPATRMRFRRSWGTSEAPRTSPPTPTPRPAYGSMRTPIGTSSAAPVSPPRSGPGSSTPPINSIPRARTSSVPFIQVTGRRTSRAVPAVRTKDIWRKAVGTSAPA